MAHLIKTLILRNAVFNRKAGHKYLCSVWVKLKNTFSGTINTFGFSGIDNAYVNGNTTDWQLLTYIDTEISNRNSFLPPLYKWASTNLTGYYAKQFHIIDLTQWFGSNDLIPADLLSHPEHFSWHYNGDLSYNVGAIGNCTGRYLVCGDRQVWDEQWEVGGISTSTGENMPNQSIIRSKNYIPIIPNTNYYIKLSTASNGYFAYWYDKNQNFISYNEKYNSNLTSPANAWYLRFVGNSAYGSTYNNDITISIYYSTGDGYNEYYPYVPPVIYDTGTEVLRKAGLAKDTKAPDGTITRRIGYVDLGSLTWGAAGSADGVVRVCSSTLNTMKVLANSITDGGNKGLYSYKGELGVYASLTNAVSTKTYSNYIYIVLNIQTIGWDGESSTLNNTVQSYLNGVILYYELATPTTEQGTPFSENIQINDYGAMWWLDTSNAYITIPQGTKLFYPADYVLLIDSLNSYTNGDVTALAKKSDLLPKLSSASADGTYVLKAVKSGTTITYSWVAET